eukprot:5433614-Amphidinium_carterae.1
MVKSCGCGTTSPLNRRDRISTFCGRLKACTFLLENVYSGHLDPLVDAPICIWSTGQHVTDSCAVTGYCISLEVLDAK